MEFYNVTNISTRIFSLNKSLKYRYKLSNTTSLYEIEDWVTGLL